MSDQNGQLADEPRLYSVKATAKILSVSDDFIRERIRDGRIKSVKLGDRTMIHIDEVFRLETDGCD